MKKLLPLFAFSFLALAIALPSSVFGATYEWNQLSSEFYLGANGTNRADTDSDASFIVIAGDQRIYISDDGGNTFVESQPAGDSDFSWHAVASDADGSNLIVGNSTRLYRSTTTGASWAEIQPAGDTDKNWHRVASDADGSNLFVVVNDERLYVSDDGGDTWSETRPEGDVNKSWGTIASDADGSNLIVGVSGGRLYLSDNGGDTWTETQPDPLDLDKIWLSTASDGDGSTLIVGNDDRLFTSADGGDTWTERQPAGDTDLTWISVDSDADGSHLAAVVQGGRLYTSDDGGETWTTEEVGNSFNETWRSVAIDSTGTHVLGVTGFNGSFLGGPDETGPVISSLDPYDDATQVVINGTLNVTFNEDIATSTGDITIHKASDDSLVETIDIAGSNVTLLDTTTLEINPTADLELATEYYVLIDAGAIEDLSGNPFAGISDPTTWSFTTDTVPTVSVLTPADNAVDFTRINDNYEIHITFDQSVAAGTGNITLHKVSDDSVVETFDVTNPAAVSFDGIDMYLFSAIILDYNTEYYFLVPDGTVEDENGNAFAGISDPTTWSFTTGPTPTVVLDDTFVTGDGFDDVVRALAIDADGKILVGGQFSTYDGEETGYGITRLNADGSLDDTFVTGDGFDEIVYALAIDADGKILVGGAFNTYDGDTTNYIARLNTDGTLDDTFVTGGGFDEIVYALAIDADGKILVGGAFNTYDGDTTNYIARLNTDGTLDDTFVTGDGFDGETLSITIDLNGKILVGGAFNTYDGDTTNYIARLNTDGTLDDTFVTGDGFDDPVDVLAIDADGKIIVGGEFSTYDGSSVAGIARLNTDGTLDGTFTTTGGFNNNPNALHLDAEGKIIIGGFFTEYSGDTTNRIARLNADGSLDDTFVTGGGFDEIVYALAIDADGKILVGGAFNTYDGEEIGYGIARLIPPADEEETPPSEEDSGSTASHRRGGGGGSTGGTTGGDSSLLTTLRTLIIQFIAQGGTPSPAMLAFLGTPSTTSSDYTRDLDIGDVGDDVRALQNFLITQNKGPQAQALAVVGATGFFGPLTQVALAEYQASVGITPAVGFFGPVTRAFVNSL